MSAAPAHAQAPAFLVRDINGGPFPATSYLGPFVQIGATTFFWAYDGVTEFALWKSDGTEAGTVRVKDIPPAGPSESLVNVNGTLFFTAAEFFSPTELWRSDGTEAGTLRVKDIQPGAGTSSPGSLVDVGGTLLFAADDGVAGRELWRSDGTDTGTVLVDDIAAGSASSRGEEDLAERRQRDGRGEVH